MYENKNQTREPVVLHIRPEESSLYVTLKTLREALGLISGSLRDILEQEKTKLEMLAKMAEEEAKRVEEYKRENE